jgi:hypothetical protein
MSHVIIRGASGRRHEVDFGDAGITVSLHASTRTVELAIKAMARKPISRRTTFQGADHLRPRVDPSGIDPQLATPQTVEPAADPSPRL